LKFPQVKAVLFLIFYHIKADFNTLPGDNRENNNREDNNREVKTAKQKPRRKNREEKTAK
jgi:hypothetical protein